MLKFIFIFLNLNLFYNRLIKIHWWELNLIQTFHNNKSRSGVELGDGQHTLHTQSRHFPHAVSSHLGTFIVL